MSAKGKIAHSRRNPFSDSCERCYMRTIKVEATNERIIPASGLAVVGAILEKSNFVKNCSRMGSPQYEAVHEFDDDKEFYQYALGITRAIPSEEPLRQRMNDIGDGTRGEICSFLPRLTM